MLRIAGQTGRPIGQKFFVDTHEWPGGFLGYKIAPFFNIIIKKFTGNAGPFG